MPRLLVWFVLVALLLIARGGCQHTSRLRVATFNIRNFGVAQTDVPGLLARLGALDADVIAVQEIQDPTRFASAVAHPRRAPAPPHSLSPRALLHVRS